MKITHLFAAFGLATLSLASCEKPYIDPSVSIRAEDSLRCGTKPPSTKGDTVTVTVRNNICGTDIWGGLVLEMPNGEIVKPVDAGNKNIYLLPRPTAEKRYKAVLCEVKTFDTSGRLQCFAVGPYEEKVKRMVVVHYWAEDSTK